MACISLTGNMSDPGTLPCMAMTRETSMPPANMLVTKKRSNVNNAHTRNWVRHTSTSPMTLPMSSWNGFTEEIITSMIRLDFSSITPVMIMLPNMNMNM